MEFDGNEVTGPDHSLYGGEYSHEFHEWDRDELLKDEIFMRNQRNRMMYRTLVLKSRKMGNGVSKGKGYNLKKVGHGLQAYLDNADLSDKDNYFTRGLRFIADMVNAVNEDKGLIERVTLEELYNNPAIAYEHLMTTIGINAFITMLVRDEFERMDATDGRRSHTGIPTLEIVRALDKVGVQAHLVAKVEERLMELERGYREVRCNRINPLSILNPDGFKFIRTETSTYNRIHRLLIIADDMVCEDEVGILLGWDMGHGRNTKREITLDKQIKNINKLINKIEGDIEQLRGEYFPFGEVEDTEDKEKVEEEIRIIVMNMHTMMSDVRRNPVNQSMVKEYQDEYTRFSNTPCNQY